MRPNKVVASALLCGILLLPSAAGAAPSTTVATLGSAVPTTTLKAAPLVKQSPLFTVQLQPDLGMSDILVAARVTTETALPVRVRMPVPAGARIDWVGEVGSGDGGDYLESHFSLLEDGTILEMVLTTSRTAQYQATYLVPTHRGDSLVSELEWTQSVPASAVRFAVRGPATIDNVVVSPASKLAPQFTDDGDRLYVLDTKEMKVGEKTTVKVVYRAWGAGPSVGAAAAPTSGVTAVVVALAAVLAIAVGALVLLMRRQRRSKRPA